MPTSPQQRCCILGECCLPGSPEQAAALAKLIEDDEAGENIKCLKAAKAILAEFRLVAKQLAIKR